MTSTLQTDAVEAAARRGRAAWRALETFHIGVYFAPEPAAAYAELGVPGRAGYFASRSAPLGAASAELVRSTFYVFAPSLISKGVPACWKAATPEQMLQARLSGVDAYLRSALGEAIAGPEITEVAELAREAAGAADTPGRPLFAGHAALPWPDQPHLQLWHAASLIREHRGDGHIALLVAAEIDPVEAMVLTAAAGLVPEEFLKGSRGWTGQEWTAGQDRLRTRGLLDQAGGLTDAGRSLRDRIERDTDRLAVAPALALGPDRLERLTELTRPLAAAVADAVLPEMLRPRAKQ